MLVVEPQIEPFTFNLNAINGESLAKVLCTIVAGDLPIRVAWLKNGVPLTSKSAKNVRITQLDDVMVMLTLSSLTVEDSGNYTCKAENSAGVATFTAPLFVKGVLEDDKNSISVCSTKACCVFRVN